MNQYFINDARTLDTLPLGSGVDLIITSPPYFDMKDYGSKNQIGFGQTYEKYLDDIEVVFNKCFSITKNNGGLWVVVDILKKDGHIKLLPFDMVQRIQKSGWQLRDIIIWQKDKTIPYTHAGEMRNIFEYVLYFTKSSEFKYYRERITSINDIKEWWQKYPERYSPKGKSPTNIWDFPIPLQGSWGKHYIKHFCPLPEELIERIIHLTTDIGDLVFDPFAGSGAVLSAAYKLQRQYAGCDLNSVYKKMFLNYLENVQPIDVNALYKNKDSKRYAETIEKLRLLKFPKNLYLLFKKKYPQNNSILAILAIPNKQRDKNLPKNILNSCTYWFITSTKQPKLNELLGQLSENKPLSKYGINPTIITGDLKTVLQEAPTILKKLWRYDRGITYRSGIPINCLTVDEVMKHENKTLPPIYSTINIDEKELELPEYKIK